MSAQEVQELFKLHLELEAKVKREEQDRICGEGALTVALVILSIACSLSFVGLRDRIESRIAVLPTQKAPETPKPAATTATAAKPRVMRQLHSDDMLNEGDVLQSENGEYELILQQHDNLLVDRGKQHQTA